MHRVLGMYPYNRSVALGQVGAELARVDERWGVQNHTPHEWFVILCEEVGEVAKELAEARINKTGLQGGLYRAELLQVAAMAVAAIESYDRASK